jgi:hypothetical protein
VLVKGLKKYSTSGEMDGREDEEEVGNVGRQDVNCEILKLHKVI